MASKNAKSKSVATEAEETPSQEAQHCASKRPPKGFSNETARDIDGWYEPEVGVAVQGQLVGYLVIPSKKPNQADRQVALLELHHSLMATKDKEEILLESGQTLGVGIRHQLKTMLDYIENKCEVWFQPLKKVELPDGNSMWTFEQHYKGQKKPLAQMSRFARQNRQSSNDDADDSVPDNF